MAMNLMTECPRCGSLTGTDPWRLARGDAFACCACSATTRPTPALRRMALRLLRVRKAVDIEVAQAADYCDRQAGNADRCGPEISSSRA